MNDTSPEMDRREAASQMKWARALQGEGATTTADLAGYIHDLERTQAACTRLINESHTLAPDQNLMDIFWEYAVIAYGRCFQRDARTPLLPEYLELLSVSSKKTHADVLAIRNKYVAHSESGLELVIPIYLLNDPDLMPKGVRSVGTIVLRRSWGSAVEAAQLLQLAQEYGAILKSVQKALQASIKAQAQAMDLDELYAEPPIQLKSNGTSEGIRLRRSKAGEHDPAQPWPIA